jgi:predicted transcriptional regulator
MPSVTKRSVAIKVNLTPELHERLREVAAQLGQAPASVASMAISVYVSQLSRSLGAADRMVDRMAEEAGPELRDQLRLAMTGEGSKS